jgi:hypothetical protein
MKLHAGTNVIEKSGDFEESQFSIEASAKAFFILSDGLYSNKILAVVRELSTNAYDSHVDAEKRSVPFDVHLPTPLSPVFFIRDYGTSMDHESCMQLYTTYFRSTRNNSNDAVGCLGLGSKAPFAYSDSFTVEAYLGGTKRIYNAYKNEDGNPVFSLMDTVGTNEADGIKVAITVGTNDIYRFRKEAENVYRYFTVKPNFIGEKISYQDPVKVLDGDNWYFDEHGENVIIMGQIAYPLDYSQVVIPGDKISEKNSHFLYNSDGLRIFANIGDVDITPSRESLSYSKQTKININNILSNILNDISNKIENKIKSQPNIFQARLKYVQIADQCSSIKTAVDSLHKSITWNDQKLFDNIASESVSIKDKINVSMLEKSGYRTKMDVKYNVENVRFSNKSKFIVNDLPRGGISRTRQFMKDYHNGVVCYMYNLSPGETVDSCSFYGILGGATKEDVVLTSSMPKIEYNRNSSGGSGGPAIQAQVFNIESGKFEECKMSVQYENAYYFLESKEKVTVGHRTMGMDELGNAISVAYEKCAEEMDGKTFYLLKPFVAKNRKIDERPNWCDGTVFLGHVFSKLINENKSNILEVLNKQRISTASNDRWVDIINITQSNSVAKQIVKEYNEYSSRIENMGSDMRVLYNISRYFPNCEIENRTEKQNSFAARFDNAMKKYPMLNLIGYNYHGDASRKIVADYIDSVEQASVLAKF